MSGSASAPPAAERSVSEAEADYDRYTAEFCAHIGDKGGWPTHVLTDPTKRPRVVRERKGSRALPTETESEPSPNYAAQQ